MSPWLWTESRANVRLITLDSLLPTLTPGIKGRQFGVHGLDHHRPRLTRSRIQPRSNFRDGHPCKSFVKGKTILLRRAGEERANQILSEFRSRTCCLSARSLPSQNWTSIDWLWPLEGPHRRLSFMFSFDRYLATYPDSCQRAGNELNSPFEVKAEFLTSVLEAPLGKTWSGAEG